LKEKTISTAKKKGKGINANTRENRDLFIDFLKKHDLVTNNTLFQKCAKELVAYKEKVPAHNPISEEYQGENTGPYNFSKYAQCDFMVSPKKWNNTVMDCESRVDVYRASVHIPLHAKISTSMKKQNKPNEEKGATMCYRPAEEQRN
jgi:hypothetical protein